METLREGLELFELVGMPARNLSGRTRKEYANDLTDLVAFLEQRGLSRIREVSLTDLEPYQAEMDRRGYKPSTRNRKTHAIKAWFTFLERQGVITRNAATKLIPPSPTKREPRYLSKEEYRRLLLGRPRWPSREAGAPRRGRRRGATAVSPRRRPDPARGAPVGRRRR